MEYSGKFFFDPNDKIYRDHFPGNAVVPGSLIIEAFINALKNKMNIKINSGLTIENFRFKKFIKPGEYDFSIILLENTAACYLFILNETAVSGKVRL